MNKLILLLLTAVMTTGSAWAQKGEQSIGAIFGINSNIADSGSEEPSGTFIGGGLRYLYNLSDRFSVGPTLMYYGHTKYKEKKQSKISGVDASCFLNAQYYFSSPQILRWKVYAGIGLVSELSEYYTLVLSRTNSIKKTSEDTVSLGWNLGVGVDWRFSSCWSLYLEGGFLGGRETGCAAFNTGISYNF